MRTIHVNKFGYEGKQGNRPKTKEWIWERHFFFLKKEGRRGCGSSLFVVAVFSGRP